MVIILKYLICNLKAHKTYSEIIEYKNNLLNLSCNKTELILAPTSIYLPMFKELQFLLCIQDIPLNEELNLTGDYSLKQLKSLDIKYCIIGHHERRKYYKENEFEIITKIKAALNNKIKVIYCIGESKEELLRKVEYQVLERQIARILNKIPTNEFENIIIAYEPTYMIGGKSNLDFKDIEKKIYFIKNLIDNYYHGSIKVIYGGNINSENIKSFNKIKCLDGFIIGNACLDITNLNNILENM